MFAHWYIHTCTMSEIKVSYPGSVMPNASMVSPALSTSSPVWIASHADQKLFLSLTILQEL